ncbi:marine proteobacterial sortase target protein [Desulfomarina sp.]
MKNILFRLQRKTVANHLNYGIVMQVIPLVLVLLFLFSGTTDAQVPDSRQGELLFTGENGRTVSAPLLSQDVDIKISGVTARVTVIQEFINLEPVWLDARYLFPLPDACSVDHLFMRIGEREIEGVIREKQEARRLHEAARRSGRKSSLVEQNRPNIFTTDVANIAPGEKISVRIEYQQEVALVDSIFSIRFPMVVAPRYIPGKAVRFSATGWAPDTDQVADGSKISPPVDMASRMTIPVRLNIDLACGFSLQRIESLYHGIRVNELEEGHYSITLNGEVKADRDFVLEWEAEKSKETAGALFAETIGKNQYLLLMLMPPATVQSESVAREVVFILDVSGSMAGTSIVQAKKALELALTRLQPVDHFNLIVFNQKAGSLFMDSKPAGRKNIQKALGYIGGLQADGGTEMKDALLLALDGKHHHRRIRQVIFITDGAVGNEDTLFGIIEKRLGDSRLFTVGIGSAPNSYFMTRAARVGRGTFTYIGRVSEVQEKVGALFNKLEHPVISDIRIDLGSNENEIEYYPNPIPDLYYGEPLVVTLKTGWENESLHITGREAGNSWEMVVDATKFGVRKGVGTLWARRKIRSSMESLVLGADERKVKSVVLKTALEHHLVSRYTSLVATDTMVSRPAGTGSEQAMVKTHPVHGRQVAAAVFGGGAQTATPSTLFLLLGIVFLFTGLLFCVIVIKKDSKFA